MTPAERRLYDRLCKIQGTLFKHNRSNGRRSDNTMNSKKEAPMTAEHPHPRCHDCDQFFKCDNLPPCVRPIPAAPPDALDTLRQWRTDYRNEPAILDYIEMMEVEIMQIRAAQPGVLDELRDWSYTIGCNNAAIAAIGLRDRIESLRQQEGKP